MNMVDELKHLDDIEEYPFKRDAYYKLKKVIDEGTYRIIGLAGPRRCGKTVIFKQLKETYGEKAVYIDCKRSSDDRIDDVFCAIYKDEPDTVFLLDEVTYLDNFDAYIGALDSELHNTIVLVTGSQSAAISRMLSLNFASTAYNCNTGFLTFNEYLRFIGKLELNEVKFGQILDVTSLSSLDVTKQDCYDFIYGGYSFNEVITDLNMYLTGCLNETVQSCYNSVQRVGNTSLFGIDVPTVITVMYALLFKLHNLVTSKTLVSGSVYASERRGLNNEKGIKINSDDYTELVNSALSKYYVTAQQLSSDTIRDCIAFLVECDLIVFTLHYPEGNSRRQILQWLNNEIHLSFDKVMGLCNITFKYPGFVSICLRDLSEELKSLYVNVHKYDLLPNSILGSILECEVKRYMSQSKKSIFIYDLYSSNIDNNYEVGEVDYYDPILSLAIEITVKNKSIRDTHFDKFECCDGAIRVLLSKDKLDVLDNGIIRIPYYTFLAVISSSVI